MAVCRGFGHAVLVAAIALGASGCEVAACKNDAGGSAVCATSLTRFEGDAIEPEAIAYTPGTAVTVHSLYGDIRVVEGAAGEVRVKLEPFNYRAHDAKDAAQRELANSLDYSFENLDAGITLQTGRHASTNGLGADLTLFLPPEFDGGLGMVVHGDGPLNPGNIEAEFVGTASSLDLVTMKLGDCTVNGAPSVAYTRAHCDGEIALTGISNGGTIASVGLGGGIRLELAGIDAGGGTFSTEDGDITVKFPSDASFSVNALTDEGTVVAPLLDEACVADSTESLHGYTCGDEPGGGPHFTIMAGTEGVGPSNISLEL